MNLFLLTAPTVEPITLAQAKDHLRQDTDDEDDLISSLITAARRWAEAYTRRAFITQTWRLSFDAADVPASVSSDPVAVALQIQPVAGSIITLPRPPLIDVMGITSYSTANVAATVAPATYLVDPYSTPGRVCLNDGQTWPTGLRAIDSLVVEYTAGYGATAAAVPYDIKAAIKRLVNTIYEQREDFVVGQTISRDVPSDAKTMLDPYRIIRL
jgi:uncharacterized phiE125 gp8 family phage protein